VYSFTLIVSCLESEHLAWLLTTIYLFVVTPAIEYTKNQNLQSHVQSLLADWD